MPDTTSDQGMSPYEMPELLEQARDGHHLNFLVAEHTARRRFEDIIGSEDATDDEYISARQRLQDMKEVRLQYEIERGYLEIPQEES